MSQCSSKKSQISVNNRQWQNQELKPICLEILGLLKGSKQNRMIIDLEIQNRLWDLPKKRTIHNTIVRVVWIVIKWKPVRVLIEEYSNDHYIINNIFGVMMSYLL